MFYMGTHLGIGVRYVDASIPIYIGEIMPIGEIMRKVTHNLSYGSAYPISVILSLPVFLHVCGSMLCVCLYMLCANIHVYVNVCEYDCGV